MKVIEEEPRVRVMEGAWSPKEVIQQVVSEGEQEDPFYVMDLGQVVDRYRRWKELMPRVEPFYAVKCNDDKMMVSTLAALGAGFDCASRAEIQLVTSLGVKPERIIFANPAKMASHIRHASAVGVTAMTFDSETELMKIKHLMPHAELVLRIRCDASAAQCPLGIKFGCDPATEAPRLLKLAAVMGLNVIGISFHVGSGASETEVYSRAIKICAALFAMGGALGLRDMHLVDIGGGFPGGADSDISEVASVINSALELHFPEREIRVIAEPGRYFAAAAYTLAALVHAKREVMSIPGDDSSDSHTMYFINDGVYGSFNCVLYDHQHVTPEPLEEVGGKPAACSVWGPSCDGLDCVWPAGRLPPLSVGSWLLFRDMGAYTLPVASPFNGFPTPTVRYCASQKHWLALKELCPMSELLPLVENRPSVPLAPIGAPRMCEEVAPPLAFAPVFVECALK